MINMSAGEAPGRRRCIQVRDAFHLYHRHHAEKQAAIEPVKTLPCAAVHRHAQRKHFRREPAVELKRYFGYLAALHALERHLLDLGVRAVDVNAMTISDQKSADNVVEIRMGHVDDSNQQRLASLD